MKRLFLISILLLSSAAWGQSFDAAEFRKLCKKWICVPDACDIVCKTDAMVMRDLRSGKIKGFRLNGRAWAVEKASAEQEWKDYVSGPPRVGQPRQIGTSRSPRVIRKKNDLHAKKSTVRSRPGGK